MPEIVACPQCQRPLRIQDDLLGQEVKCPACRTTFTATTGRPPPAPAEPQPERYPTRERDRREDRWEDEGRDRRRRREDYEDEEEYDRPRRFSRDEVRQAAGTKVAAGICGILLGAFGVHKFIIGLTTPGIIMLLVTLLTCFIGGVVMSIIGLIEGIIYLTKTDEEFYRLYYVEKKEWF
jgi:predicted Zn finger-like uncharacterized protein